MKPVAIVTPIHKSQLDGLELRRLQISIRLNSDLPHYFVIPSTLERSTLSKEFPHSIFVELDPSNFESIQSYNRLLLNIGFYKLFDGFEFIQILQVDSFLQRAITPILSLDYDYIGAPWRKPFRVSLDKKSLHPNNNRHFFKSRIKVQVGNGGLSLRKVQSMITLINYAQKQTYSASILSGIHNEDLIISYLAIKKNLRIPDIEMASSIFTEDYWNFSHEIESIYGFHALEKYNTQLETELIQRFSE